MIGTTGTETRFLDETDLPGHARLNVGPMSPKAAEEEDKLLAEAIHKSQTEHQGKDRLVEHTKISMIYCNQLIFMNTLFRV